MVQTITGLSPSWGCARNRPRSSQPSQVLQQYIQQDDVGQGLFRHSQAAPGIAFPQETIARTRRVTPKQSKRVRIVINRQHRDLLVHWQFEAEDEGLVRILIRDYFKRPVREFDELTRQLQAFVCYPPPHLSCQRRERASAGNGDMYMPFSRLILGMDGKLPLRQPIQSPS